MTPHLIVRGAAEAIELYKKGFGEEEISHQASSDGAARWHTARRIAAMRR